MKIHTSHKVTKIVNNGDHAEVTYEPVEVNLKKLKLKKKMEIKNLYAYIIILYSYIILYIINK